MLAANPPAANAAAAKTLSVKGALLEAIASHRAIEQNAEQWDTASPEFQARVQSGLEMLLRCQAAAETLQLFSPNETAADVGTGDLPFLLVPALLGDVMLQLAPPRAPLSPTAERLQTLRVVADYYQRFFRQLDDYGLLEADDRAFLEQCVTGEPLDGPSEESEAPKRRGVSRDERIARYRAEKELDAKIAALEERQKAAAARAGEDDDEDLLGCDEALARKLVTAQIAQTARKTLESFCTLVDERLLLEAMAGRAPPPAEPLDRNPAWRLDPSTPMLDKGGRVLRPFVITSAKRRELLDGVFRPHWNLPTMTIDEYLELERERGNFIEGGGNAPSAADAGAQTSTEETVQEDADLAAQDAETMRLREWDAFKDDNPKGWGNRGANRG